jgi:hypothetical protein
MRLMTWNINRFNQATFNRSIWNADYIYTTALGQALDILIVIEVQTAHAGVRGQLITGNGQTGVMTLLNLLRASPGNPDWRLVPPARLSNVFAGDEYNEGIAVFYNNGTLNFTGPNYIDAHGITTPNVLNAAAAYPLAWNGALPGGNNRAGRVDFQRYDDANTTLNFPTNQDRRPWYTTFTERGGALRNLKLFSVHLPPNTARASEATMNLSLCAELRNGIGANDVVIVAGDFNVNLVNLQVMNHVDFVRYSYLYAAMNSGPEFGAAETRIAGANAATLQGNAPGYGYLLNESLDNVYLRYGAGLAAPGHNATVVNRVIGTGVAYPIHMVNPIPAILAAPWLAWQKLAVFQQFQNYGHLAVGTGGTSDHLPLVIDI